MKLPFTNLRIWRLATPWTMSGADLEQALARNFFAPCDAGQDET